MPVIDRIKKSLDIIMNPKYPKIFSPLIKTNQNSKKSTTRVMIMMEDRYEKGTATDSGLLQLNKLNGISNQLALNSQHAKSGPGYPTSLYCLEDLIAIGTNSSMVLLYDTKEHPISVLGSYQDSSSLGAVTAICANEMTHMLFVGYISGKINIWDYTKKQLIKTVDGTHKLPITFIKIWKNGYVSCDSGGECVYNTISKKLLMTSVESIVIPHRYGQILSGSIYVNEAEKIGLIALSNYQKVRILLLSKLNEPIFEVDSPETSKAICKVNFCYIKSQGYETKPVLSMVISWGKQLQIFKILNDEGKIQPMLINHIKFEYTIYVYRFLNNHTMIFLTSEKVIVVFDTIALQEVDTVDVKDLNFVYSYLKDTNDNELSYINYENTISCLSDSVFLLCLNSFYNLYTVDIKTRIKNCKEKNDWLTGFNIILDYYKTTLDNGMLDEYLQYLDKYLDYSFDKKQIELNSKKNDYFKIIAGACCEYTIGIRQSYLLTQLILKYFENAGELDLYIEILSSYLVVLNDVTIPPPVLSLIIDYYCKHDQSKLAEEWLLRLDINAYDKQECFEAVIKHKLLFALINLSCKHNHSYGYALESLYKLYCDVNIDEKTKININGLIIAILHYSIENISFPEDINCKLNENNLSDIIDVLFCKECPENPEPYFRLSHLLLLNITLIIKIITECFRQPNTTLFTISSVCSVIGEYLFNDNSFIELDQQYDSSYFLHYYIFVTKMLVEHSDCILPNNLTTSCILCLLQAIRGDLNLYTPYTNDECLCKIIDNIDTKHYDPVQVLCGIQDIGLKEAELKLLKKMNRYGDVIKIYLNSEKLVNKDLFNYLNDSLDKCQSSQEFYLIILPFISSLIKKNAYQTIDLLLQIPESDFNGIISKLKLDNVYYLFLKELLSSRGDIDFMSKLHKKGVVVDDNIEFEYFKELCMYSPNEVLGFVTKHLYLPVTECIEYCERYNVIDCTAFLYERVGNSQGAIDLLNKGFNESCDDIIEILKNATLIDDTTVYLYFIFRKLINYYIHFHYI